MKYEVIRTTNFMGMRERESEGSYKTRGEAENHISKAIEQERNIMGMKISQFNIIKRSVEEWNNIKKHWKE